MNTKENKQDAHLLSFIPNGFEAYGQIKIIVDLSPSLPADGHVLPMNTVNTHIFKPRFFNNNGELIAYVASMDVAMQTISAINKYVAATGMNKPVMTLEEKDVGDTYKFLLKDFVPTEHVVIGQCFTVIEYLYFHRIQEVLGEQIAWNFMAEFNSKHWQDKFKYSSQAAYLEFLNDYLKSQARFSEFAGHITIESEISGTFVKASKLRVGDKVISVIQRPWGIRLAEELGKYLARFEQVEKVFFVGGCAGLVEGMEIDDIVLPTAFSSQERDRVAYPNSILVHVDEKRRSLWRRRLEFPKFHLVPIYTVATSLSSGGLSSKLSKTGIGAMEMELDALFVNIGSKNVYPLLYIMDLPVEGISLGDTYYNYNFLADLAAKQYRGNIVCYDLVLRELLD